MEYILLNKNISFFIKINILIFKYLAGWHIFDTITGKHKNLIAMSLKEDLNPNPNQLKDQVIRVQELIFDFTKQMSELKRKLDLFDKNMEYWPTVESNSTHLM